MNYEIPMTTGVILVGGKSSRMGRDKAFLRIDGDPLFDRILTAFRACFTRTILVGDRAERFTGYGVDIIPDIYPGSALGGLYTGLLRAETEFVFVSSCDMAFPNVDLIRYLCSLHKDFDAVVPATAIGYEPLFALYAKSCLGPIKAQLERGELCAYAYYPRIRVRYVDEVEVQHIDRERKAFMNINTPEDYQNIGGTEPDSPLPRQET